MKRLLSLTLALVMILSLSACGQSAAAQSVDEQIDAIGEVTLDSESKIAEAESALAGLAEEDRKQVKGAEDLAKARTAYEALVVEEAITAIGTVTLDSGDAITAACAAYDGASAEVQAAVRNAAQLSAAEASISDLRVQKVTEMIDAIGEVTPEDSEAIQTAQNMLNALFSEDAAKVTNAGTLEMAAQSLKALKEQQAEALLANIRKDEDRIQNINFYSPKALKYYSNGSWAAVVRCFILPYLGRNDSSVWLRLIYNYTGSDWVFFEKAIVVADGQKFEKSFDYSDIVRDNEAYSVWEYVDDTVSASGEKMLWAIANSKETLVRFQGDDYMHDFTVNATDKQAIREVMTAYDALK